MDVSTEVLALVVGIVSAAGGAGGAWGAAHQRIRSAETKLSVMEEQLEKHDLRTRSVAERLARIEALLETIDGRLRRSPRTDV